MATDRWFGVTGTLQQNELTKAFRLIPGDGQIYGLVMMKPIQTDGAKINIEGNIPVPTMTSKNWLVGARVNNEPVKDAIYDPTIGAVTGFGGYIGSPGLVIELIFI